MLAYNASIDTRIQVMTMQQQSNWPRRFQKLGLIGLLLLAVNFTYQIYYRYIAPPTDSSRREQCDLTHKPCTVALSDNRKIAFEIQPHEFSASQKLTFSVELDNIKPESVTLTLMPIGQVQHAKDIDMKDFGANHYTAIARLDQILPNQQKWLAMVRVHTADQNIAFPFKFTV